jgi:hypothetical protein
VVDAATFKAEQEQADHLMSTARAACAKVLAGSTVAIATALVRTLGGDQTPQQVALRLQRLRHDVAVANTIAMDLGRAQGQAQVLIADALWMGYRTAAVARADAMSRDGLIITADPTDADRAALVTDYPILGHTASEIAAQLTTKLRFDLDAAITMPLTGSSDPAALPVALKALSEEHAGRVAGAVDAAYFAGVQAAVKAIGQAITGA